MVCAIQAHQGFWIARDLENLLGAIDTNSLVGRGVQNKQWLAQLAEINLRVVVRQHFQELTGDGNATTFNLQNLRAVLIDRRNVTGDAHNRVCRIEGCTDCRYRLDFRHIVAGVQRRCATERVPNQ